MLNHGILKLIPMTVMIRKRRRRQKQKREYFKTTMDLFLILLTQRKPVIFSGSSKKPAAKRKRFEVSDEDSEYEAKKPKASGGSKARTRGKKVSGQGFIVPINGLDNQNHF